MTYIIVTREGTGLANKSETDKRCYYETLLAHFIAVQPEKYTQATVHENMGERWCSSIMHGSWSCFSAHKHIGKSYMHEVMELLQCSICYGLNYTNTTNCMAKCKILGITQDSSSYSGCKKDQSLTAVRVLAFPWYSRVLPGLASISKWAGGWFLGNCKARLVEYRWFLGFVTSCSPAYRWEYKTPPPDLLPCLINV